ncbi:MAG TPA: nitrous oxide-stimulated promoter family protein [Syntrophomonadaceae bacterium]|nr:nitrous oxide-stimulated promoter family protein [Syntrophomonadaceae bacterium]
MAFSRKLEVKTLAAMITIYCHKMHETRRNELCPECTNLLSYAEKRIDKCVYGDNKPVCSKCAIHCYKSDMRESIKNVMKYSGPRMLLTNPILSLRYFYRKIFKSNA